MTPLFAIIIAAVLVLFLLSRRDNGPLPLPPAPDDERPTRAELSRRWVEDYTQAAYNALDAGKVEEARHWWGVAGGDDRTFDEMLEREGKG